MSPIHPVAKLRGLRRPGGLNGFTLIELLIVIAIILILIAIALPNFLEAQIRARVTKSKAELRTIETGMMAYYLDWKVYPWESENDCAYPQPRTRCGLAWLTSPVAYITAIPDDTFPDPGGPSREWYETGILPNPPIPNLLLSAATWAIWTRGPDGLDTELVSGNADGNVVWENKIDGSADSYSPTNGTKSMGDIFLFGGDSYWIGVRTPRADKGAILGFQPLVVNGTPYLHRLPPSSL